MTKFLKNADVTGYISQTSVTSSLVKTDANGKLIAAAAGTDYQAPTTALLPAGGTAGQILSKIDATNYNTQWIDNFAQQIKYDVKLGAALTKGTPVYVSSANGTNMIVSAASNTAESTSSKTLGLLETGGALNDIVKVVSDGLLAGLDTSTALAGDPVWLGPSGTLLYGLANKPVAPVHMVFIGIVTRVQSVNGEIFVKVQNGFELEELHNVAISSVANNQGLFYESATSLWKNKTIATVLGYTPVDASLTANYIPKATGATTIANSLIYDNGTSVGINTASPDGTSKLTVNGRVNIYGPGISTSTTTYGLVVDPSGGGVDNLWVRDDGTTYIRGNTLIGTTTDAGYKLDVNGTGRYKGLLFIDNATASTAKAIEVWNATGANYGTWYDVGANNNKVAFGASSTIGGIPSTPTITLDYSNNYVGIGTTSPTTILTLRKAIDSAAYGSGTRMIDFKSYFTGYDTETVKASIYAGVSSLSTQRTDNGYLAFMTADTGVLYERLRIEKNGNVGIGTTSPSTILHISSLVPTFTINRLPTGTQPKISFTDNGTEIAYIQPSASTGVMRYDMGPSAAWGGIHAFFTDQSERLRINASGNVLINTTTDAGYKLDVNGSARVNGNIFFAGNNISFATYDVSVGASATVKWSLVRNDGTAITTTMSSYLYRIKLITLGTGTDTGTTFLAQNIDGLGWSVRTVYRDSTGSNNPYLFVDADGLPKVTTAHASTYTVRIIVEEIYGYNSGATIGVFGSDSIVSYVGGATSISGSSVALSGSLSGTSATFSTDLISQYHTIQDLGNTGDYVLRFRNNAGTQIGYIGRVASDNKTYYSNSNGHSFTGGLLTAPRINITAGTLAEFGFLINQQSTFAFGSTNGRRIAYLGDLSVDDNGLQFGYDTTDKTGIIAGAATSAGTGIDFYTYNGSSWGNRARLTKDGNVGIGTTSPNSLLHVRGNVSSSSTTSITLEESAGGATEIVFKSGDATYNRRGALRFYSNQISTTTAQWVVGSSIAQTAGDNKFYFYNASSTSLLTLTQSNVGIGTTSPSSKLHVSVGNVDGIRVQSSNSGYLETGKTGGARWRWANEYSAANILELLVNDLAGGTPGQNVLTVSGSGNVSIGTTTDAGYKLDVNGQGRFSSKLTVNNLAWINRPSNKVDNNGATEFGGRVEFNNAFAAGQGGYIVAYYPTYNNFLITADYDGNVGGVQPNIQIGRGATPAIHVQNSGATLGNVGIGITSPDYKLTVSGGPVRVTDGTRDVFLNPSADFGAGSIGPALQVSTNHALQIATNNSLRAIVTSGGNVLINTTTDAGYKLDVNGTGRFASSVSAATEYRLNTQSYSRVAILDGGGGFAGGYNFNINSGTAQHDSTGAVSGYWYKVDGSVNFYTDSSAVAGTSVSPRLAINAAGAATFSSSVTAAGVTLSGGNTLQLAGGTGNNWQLYKDGSNGLQFYLSGGGPAMYINSSQNVGIGTTSPASTLDVAGGIVTTNGAGTTYNQFANSGTDVIWENRQNGAIIIRNNSSTERMRITSAGQIQYVNTGNQTSLVTYSSAQDRGYTYFYQAQNFPTTNAYTRIFDIVSSGDATGGGAIRFLTSAANSAPATTMYLSPAGNVGIGTTSPGTQLQIDAAAAPTIRFNASGATGGAGSIQFYNQSVQKWNLTTISTSNDFALYNNGGTNTYNVYIPWASGNVLIGTTTDAGYKLHVNGTAKFGSTYAAYYTVPGGTGYNTFEMGADSTAGGWYVYDNTNSSYRLKIANSGAATFSSSVTAGSLFINSTTGTERINVNGAIGFQNTSGTQKYHVSYWAANNGLNFAETAVADARLFIKDGGNVGIGTTNAVSRLTVMGSSSGNVATFTSQVSGSGEYSGITLAAQIQGSDIWYASELRNINTASNPNWLNPRLGIFVQNTNTYLAADRVERMSITSAGNVGIGTTSPSKILTVRHGAGDGLRVEYSGNTDNILIDASNISAFAGTTASVLKINPTGGNVLIGTTTDNGYKLNVNGQVIASAYFESSDKKLKDISFAQDSNTFGAIQFNWKDKRDVKNHWGYVAQDVAKFIPDAVIKGDDGYLSVDYNQAHTFKIAKVEDEVTLLKKRVAELEQQLNLN